MDLYGIYYAIKMQIHRGTEGTGICAIDFGNKASYSGNYDVTIAVTDERLDGVVGFNRLSIKDLSLAEHQPMTALAGKVVLTFNGEIYIRYGEVPKLWKFYDRIYHGMRKRELLDSE